MHTIDLLQASQVKLWKFGGELSKSPFRFPFAVSGAKGETQRRSYHRFSRLDFDISEAKDSTQNPKLAGYILNLTQPDAYNPFADDASFLY